MSKKSKTHIIDKSDVRSLEIGVVAGELEDLAYKVECISHAVTALKYLVYYNDMEMSVAVVLFSILFRTMLSTEQTK